MPSVPSLLCALALGFATLTPLHAQVSSQTRCFESTGRSQPRVGVVLQSYRDDALDLDVGALLRYRTSDQVIRLVYVGTAAAPGDVQGYETQWLEVVDGKITGRYGLIKPGSATIAGAYLVYRNARTGRKTTFTPVQAFGGDCRLDAAGRLKE